MRCFALLMITALVSCSPGGGRTEKTAAATDAPPPELSFVNTSFDFGEVLQGEKVACGFVYKNKGGQELVIHEASASCGCTVPTFSREPLLPGAEGRMEVVFDTAGRTGVQVKSIHVRSNAKNNPVILTIKANVVL